MLHTVPELVLYVAAGHTVQGPRARRPQAYRHILHLDETIGHEASEDRPEVPLWQERELGDFFFFEETLCFEDAVDATVVLTVGLLDVLFDKHLL